MQHRLVTLCAAGVIAASGVSASEPAGEPSAELPAGRLLLQLRPRFTYVDQGNKPLRAQATNLRTLLGWRSLPIDDWQLTAQLVNVSWRHPLHATHRPGDFASPYPLVGDPATTSVNLLHADYTGWPDTTVRIGRQAIRLDNERFVGDADVRQVPQVFDAVTLRNTSLPDTRLFAGLTRQVRTYFGHTLPSRSVLLNARTDLDAGLSLGAYAYFVDQPRAEYITLLPDNSQRTLGLRLEGNPRLAPGLSLYVAAEAAWQRPWADGDARIRAGYHRLAIGPTWGPVSLQFGLERLGSNGGVYGLQTPLSYNTFQGWAYQFFNTPPTGVRDRSVALAAAQGRLNLWLKFHWFYADAGGARYGTEWDLAAALRLREDLSLRVVMAHFRRDLPNFRPKAQRYTATLQYDY